MTEHLLWMLIFAIEVLFTLQLTDIEATARRYIAAIGLTTIQLLCSAILGEDELVWDMRDLWVWDIGVQCVGLILALCNSDYLVYAGLTNAIFILKLTRLLWPIRTSDGTALVAWPIFGPIGYFRHKYTKNITKPVATPKQNAWVYGAIFASIVTSFTLQLLHIKAGFVFFASIIIVIIYGGYRQFIGYLHRQHILAAEATVRAAREAATAAANANLTQLNQTLVNTNAELAIATANAEQRADTLRRASHDLRLPLTAIIRLTEDTLAQTDPATQAAMGQTLLAFLTQFGETISDTIELAKLLTNITQVQIAPWTPLELAQFPYQQLKIIANHQETPLLLRISRQGTFRVLADDGLVNRILVNLIGNALQHSNGSKVLLTLRKRGNLCQIAVWDKGRGIPEANGADGAANFAAFATAVANRTQAGRLGAGRHGLGIDNVRELCAAMGGQMQLHSRPDRFTVFWFDLPLAGKVTN